MGIEAAISQVMMYSVLTHPYIFIFQSEKTYGLSANGLASVRKKPARISNLGDLPPAKAVFFR